MSKYIETDKLLAEIERLEHENCMNGGEHFCMRRAICLGNLRNIITPLYHEQPDNEDIDKVAQELYGHLYELKRRNNVPTNLYDKQEIIDLWKAGVEYGRNHPKQEQPELPGIEEPGIPGKDFIPVEWVDACEMYGKWKIVKQEQPEVDYNIIPLPEEKMARYIAYCLGREDDDCNCPTCGKHVTGLRLFPYYYDRENNDVYFASVCPECGKIIISKE